MVLVRDVRSWSAVYRASGYVEAASDRWIHAGVWRGVMTRCCARVWPVGWYGWWGACLYELLEVRGYDWVSS